MLGALIYLLGSIHSHTFLFIASVDAVAFTVSLICAISVYFATDPVNGECLPRSDDSHESESKTHIVELVIIFALVTFQLVINELGILRLIDYAFPSALRLLGLRSAPREPDIIKTIITKFFDRWALMLICNIFIGTHEEYSDYHGPRTALFGMLAAYLRANAVYGLVSDCYKVFCGQLKGDRLRDDNFHSGISMFRERWSHLWQYELFFAATFVAYFASLVHFYSRDPRALPENFVLCANFLLLAINGLLLLALMDILINAKKYEMEIRRYCYKITEVLQYRTNENQQKVTYSTMYLSISRLFDVIKMAMFTQYVAIVLSAIPIVKFAFPSYLPNPIGVLALYTLCWATPIIYEFISRLLTLNKLIRLAPENLRESVFKTFGITSATLEKEQQIIAFSKEIQRTREYFVFFAMFLAYLACALIGAFRGCNKIEVLLDNETIDSSTASGSNSLLVYVAKSFAIPTTFGFGLVFVTSPSAARYSDSWVNLPFLLKILLAPLPWLTPHLMNKMHIASGAVFFCGGCYHALCWIFIFLVKYLTKATTGIWVALTTGLIMIVFAIKLLWPPGMDGYGTVCKRRDQKFIYRVLLQVFKLDAIDKFLMDSKYGSAHVYIALLVFFLYIVHGTVNLFPMEFYYWAFPLACWSILFILHPAKATYLGSYVERFRSANGYSRRFKVVNKTCEVLRTGSLTMVELTIKLPTFDTHFAEVYSRRGNYRYEGFCDVIMIKLRPWRVGLLASNGKVGAPLLGPKPSLGDQIAKELETVHYYSVVSIATDLEADNPTIKASLLVQNTSRANGTSAALVRNQDEDPDNTAFEVIGFMKSNSLDSIHAPRVVAFGWESGAAAFCSLFQRREEYVYSEFSDKNAFVYNKDLLVVWCSFCAKKKSYNVDDLIKILEENANFQKHLFTSSSARDEDAEGGKYVRPKIIFIYTSVPKQFTPIREHPAALPPTQEEEVQRIISSVYSAFNDPSDTIVQGILQDHMATLPDGTPSRWLSLRTAFARGLNHPECTENLVTIIQSTLASLYSGKNMCSLFIPAHENTDRAISAYKYEAIYDTINKYILEIQVQFQKNPEEALQLCKRALAINARMPDPATSYEIAVDVLYSGEYSSAKLDQLRSVVESVRDQQVFTEVPATLSFVPDA